MGDDDGCVGKGALNVLDGIKVVIVGNETVDLEWEKIRSVEAGGVCFGSGGDGRSKCIFCDCTSVDIVADVFVSGCETLAPIFIVGVWVCCAYLFGLDVDKNESVFGKFAGCKLLASSLASLVSALIAFVFPHVCESFLDCLGSHLYFVFQFVVERTREDFCIRNLALWRMRHCLFPVRIVAPHPKGGIEIFILAGKVVNCD